jgi:hypothetical protein
MNPFLNFPAKKIYNLKRYAQARLKTHNRIGNWDLGLD